MKKSTPMTSDDAMKRIHELLYPSFAPQHELTLDDLKLIRTVVDKWKVDKQ